MGRISVENSHFYDTMVIIRMCSPNLAHEMINVSRYGTIEAIPSVFHTLPECFEAQEIDEKVRLANAKYDRRIEQYDRSEKQWIPVFPLRW